MEPEDKRSTEAFERYELILNLLKNARDKMGLKLLTELINKALNYIETVARVERVMAIQKFRAQDEDEYKSEFTRLDQIRHIQHNALIDQLNIVNRYLFRSGLKDSLPFGGIYSLDPSTIENRTIVADWAYYLIEALYRRGIVKKG